MSACGVLMKPYVNFIRKNGAQLPLRHYRRTYSTGVVVVGSGSPGEPASFALRANGPGYLFNCGQGTERLARVNRILKWPSVENVFITRADWSRMGGLLSIMNEVEQHRGRFTCTIHGPAKLQPIVERMRSIIDVPNLFVKFNCSKPYVKKGLQIDLVPLSSDNDNMAFICRMDEHRDAINFGKCVDLGVPTALISELQTKPLNESVELPDGRLITLSDIVCGPIDSEKSFAVVDIPSQEYLRCLEHCDAFQQLLSTEKRLDAVMHFSPPHIFDSTEYAQFIKRTNAQRHFILNESNKYSGLHGVHRRQAQFSQLNNEIFPPLKSSVDPAPSQYSARDEGGGAVHNVSTNTNLLLRGFQKDSNDEDELHEDSESVADVLVRDEGNKTMDRASRFPKIVFLGTSSTRPGAFRNTTSILVHTSEESCILLDCGEDTCGQIIRFYGPEATEVFAKIKAIFISHLHGDHHYGLFDILLRRKRLQLSNRPPILLMVPCDEFVEWTTFCSNHVEDVTTEFQFIDNNDLITSELADEALADLNVSSLRTCPVEHIPSSFGITTTVPGCNGHASFKLTYSGDTMPCDTLVELGRNSTLLIHEATFENNLSERARKVKHSTIAQAVEQSAKMNAKYTILTHLSQRYKILPWIDGDLDANTGIAFDNMELIEEDLGKLSALHPRIETMLPQHFKNNEERAALNKSRQMYRAQEFDV